MLIPTKPPSPPHTLLPRASRIVHTQQNLPPTRQTLRLTSSNPRKSPSAASSGSQPQNQQDPKKTTLPIPSLATVRQSPLTQTLTTPFRAYARSSERRPHTTQLLSAIVIYTLGDLVSQYFHPSPNTPQPQDEKTPPQRLRDSPFTELYDPTRTLRAIVIGSIAAIPVYHWIMFLSQSRRVAVPTTWPHSTWLSLLLKTAVNQAVFTPVFNSYFFGMQAFLSPEVASPPEVAPPLEVPCSDPHGSTGAAASWSDVPKRRLASARDRVTSTVPTSWWNSCMFWPFVTLFNFRYVAVRQRSVFMGVAAVGWQGYLGVLNSLEEERGEGQRVRS